MQVPRMVSSEQAVDTCLVEYLHNYVASKVEARKIMNSPQFEEIVAKFWQILRVEGLAADLSKMVVNKNQYIQLMKRVYKVLLPLYREKEMSKEIEQEWHMDSGGLQELNYHQFGKLIFRIAHHWATHIDLGEYVELLEKVFSRITVRKVLKTTDQNILICYPTIQIEIIPEPAIDGEDPFRPLSSGAEDALLEPCPSDEEEKDGFEYIHVEDKETMTLKKHKRRKVLGEGIVDPQVEQANPLFSMKDAVVYKEEVIYHQNTGDYKPCRNDLVFFVMADLDMIIPLGYPTEQFFTWMKNDVNTKLEEAKQARKDALARMKREVLETGGAMKEAQLKKEEDGGLLRQKGKVVTVPFNLKTLCDSIKVRGRAKMVDILYNSLRSVIKDTHHMSLRLFMENPRQSIRSGHTKNRAPVAGNEPTTEINKFGYNPALQRRIRYKAVPVFSKGGKIMQMNINYLYSHSDYEAAYRCDVERVENSNKLAIKPSDEFQRDEDFLAVDTSYLKMRQIMLAKKFETLYTENLNADENDLKRIDKIVEREEQRKKAVRNSEPLNTKSVSETYEEKSVIKMMKGPFYKFISQEGLKEDNFKTCAQQDLIDYSTTPSWRIMIMGKPRSGKTTLAAGIAAKLDVVHVSVENWLERLISKIKNHDPAEDEVEEGQEPPKWLTDLEETVYNTLTDGRGPSHEMNIQILKEQLYSSLAKTKGFVLDLTFYRADKTWAKIIRDEHFLGPPDEMGNHVEFSHVIDLDFEDAEVLLRAKNMRLDPTDGRVYSKWEVTERNKPKPKKFDEDGNEIEEEEEDENAPKPLDVTSLTLRVQDTEEFINAELSSYNTIEKAALDDLLVKLCYNQYHKIEVAGMTPGQLLETAEFKIRENPIIPLRPVAKQLEGSGDFKACLTDPLFEEQPEGTLPRTWSLWQQHDPVALFKGQVIKGQPDLAVAYANNMFAFSSEENMQEFLKEPKKYLQAPPKMPQQYRLLMIGPKGIGLHTQAEKLQEKYGWKVVDYQVMVKKRLENLLKEEIHTPNNVMPGMSQIGLSQAEIDEIRLGKPFPSWKFIPWVFDELGFELAERPPPPEPEVEEGDPEELTEEEKAKKEKEKKKKEAEEAKKKKEEEEAARQKDERRKKREEAIANGQDLAELGLEESEEEIKVDDLSIDQLMLKPKEDGSLPFVGGFILLGFPQTEQHAQKMKEHGIEFDRILYFTDQSEEDPGRAIKDRNSKNLHYDWDAEVERAQKILAVATEAFGGEDPPPPELDATGTIDDIFIKIQKKIDPFFTRVDNAEDVRVSADLGEEDKKLPKGDFGDFCPVTYVKEGWLVKGNPELEKTIFGKTFLLAGEKEQEEFEFDPYRFLVAKNGEVDLPLQPPPPKVMVIGVKGAGITTQVNKLCEKYKLDSLALKDIFLAKMKEEKEKRKRRRLLDRGFKALPPPEEGEEPPIDEEIENDPEEFDMEAHYKELFKMSMDANKGLIVDGTWNGFAEDSTIPADGPGYANLLIDSRRSPEVVIVLNCKEQESFKRLIDEEATKKEYDRLMEERTERIKKEREAARKEKEQEILDGQKDEEEKSPEEKKQEFDEAMAKWEEDRDAEEEANDEADEEKPDMEKMMADQKEKITQQREADEAFLEEFKATLQEKGIPVIDDIRTDISADFVFIKLIEKLKNHFSLRQDLLEREQAIPLTMKELPFYEQSYTFKISKFGMNSPLSPSNPVKTRSHAVLYRERIYYLSDADEQKEFLTQPSKYTKGVESIPLDINYKPAVCVLGHPKCGKTTLCEQINQKTGAIHIQMHEVIQQFIDDDSAQMEKLRIAMKQEGRPIDDPTLVSLLMKRLQQKDVTQHGYVIEDFPRTKQQAILLARQGLKPFNVFYIRIPLKQTVIRARQHEDTDFGCNKTILANRLRVYRHNLPQVAGFYSKIYDSLVEIDGLKSKWFMEDMALYHIEQNIKARQTFARDLTFKDQPFIHDPSQSEKPERPCLMANLHIDRCLLKSSLSQFNYYCSVTWKNTKQLVKCTHVPEFCVFYQNVFYYFKSLFEQELFVNCPSRFTSNVIFSSEKGIPLRLKPHKAAEIVAQEKAIVGYCPVSLVEEQKVIKGDLLLVVQYKDQKYSFESEQKLQKFLVTPGKYNKAELPVKMPPHEDPVSLFVLQGNEESITFMQQALGSIVTRGLREVSENRLKYPNISVKETMLKLFSLFLKAENPANTEYMTKKYRERMKTFIERCELAEEIQDLAEEKQAKIPKGKWPQFKEKYYNDLGSQYDEVLKLSLKEKADGFASYLK